MNKPKNQKPQERRIMQKIDGVYVDRPKSDKVFIKELLRDCSGFIGYLEERELLEDQMTWINTRKN